MLIYLGSLYGYFHTITSELSSGDKTAWTAKLKIFTTWPFTESLLTPVINTHNSDSA